MSTDPADRAAELLRAAAPPPDGPGLEAPILEAFDAGAWRRARPARPLRRLALPALAAAAAFLLALVVWRRSRPEAPSIATAPAAIPAPAPRGGAPDPGSRDLAVAADERALQLARLAGLREALRELDEESAASAVQPPAPLRSDPALGRLAFVAAETGEPASALQGLVTARRFEMVDASLAAARYRELLDEHPSGAAAAVARARLAHISH